MRPRCVLGAAHLVGDEASQKTAPSNDCQDYRDNDRGRCEQRIIRAMRIVKVERLVRLASALQRRFVRLRNRGLTTCAASLADGVAREARA